MTDIDLATAKALWKDGLCVIPTAGGAQKRPFGEWKDYQRRMPTVKELEAWFATPRPAGIVCGTVSAGLEVIDLDTPEAFAAFRERFGEKVPCERSPHGGHAWYRVPAAGRNARPAEKVDLRGEGGFCVVYEPEALIGTPAETARRPTNSCVPRISEELRAEMFAFVAAPAKLPSAVPTAKLPDSATPAVPASKMEGATGAGSFRDGLLAQGWKSLGVKGDGREHFSRPGAAHPGQTDATLSPDGTAFKVFSTSAVGVAPPAEAMEVQPAAAFVAANPELNEPLWEQFARRGELFIVVGSSKVGKSLLATQLALSVAAGTPLLGRACRKGRALIVDLELPPAVLAYRLGVQAKAMGLDLAALGDGLLVSSQRCHVGGLDSLAATLGEAAADGGGFALVVVDGLYKWLDAEGIEENANAQVAGFMGRLGALCEQHGTALCLTHHRRKQSGGNGGGNAAACTADEAVGAGAFGRSVDSLHCLMQGKVPGQFELSSALRSFPGHKPLPVKRCGAIWSAA